MKSQVVVLSVKRTPQKILSILKGTQLSYFSQGNIYPSRHGWQTIEPEERATIDLLLPSLCEIHSFKISII
jgi:hypothetical protein